MQNTNVTHGGNLKEMRRERVFPVTTRTSATRLDVLLISRPDNANVEPNRGRSPTDACANRDHRLRSIGAYY